MKIFLLLLTAILTSPGLLIAAAPEEMLPPPEAVLKATATPPEIDGHFNDPAWKDAVLLGDFMLNTTPVPAQAKTTVLVTYDRDNLYVGFTCLEPELKEKLLRPMAEERDGNVWEDECIEVYINDVSRSTEQYHVLVNLRNTVMDLFSGEKFRQCKAVAWNGHWQSAVALGTDEWRVELKIPFATVNFPAGKTELRVNFCRERYGPSGEISSWSCPYGDFDKPERSGVLKNIIREGIPEIASLSWPDDSTWGEQQLALQFAAPVSGRLTLLQEKDGQLQVLAEGQVRQGQISLPYFLEEPGRWVLLLGFQEQGKTESILFASHNQLNPALFTLHRTTKIMPHGGRFQALARLGNPSVLKEISCRISGSAGQQSASWHPEQEFCSITLDCSTLAPGQYNVEYLFQLHSGRSVTHHHPLLIFTP